MTIEETLEMIFFQPFWRISLWASTGEEVLRRTSETYEFLHQNDLPVLALPFL
jgi:hypothetical protein